MNNLQPDSPYDLWSDWLLHLRHADDPEYERLVRAKIEGYAERLLDAAKLAPGMTLLDVGTGDGLVAFRAIERIGPSLRAILSDISATMLQHAETTARELQVRNQCSFLHCPADKLIHVADACVDVVTSRAVLTYVPDKTAALREFHRVLKPGGRVSVAEPIFQDEAIITCALKQFLDSQSSQIRDRFLPLLHRSKAAQFPDTKEKISKSPHANFSERDLLRFFQNSGFPMTHLELHIDIEPSIIDSWEVFVGCSPHPWAPPLKTILAQEFTPEEKWIFEQALRPSLEAGQFLSTERIAYLSAQKPTG